MCGILTQIESRVKVTARAAALTLLGRSFGLCAVACLSAVLWIVIASSEGALIAFSAIGLIYLALGFFCIALGVAQRAGNEHGHPSNHPHSGPAGRDTREPLVQLAEGFAAGLQAGRAARDSR